MNEIEIFANNIGAKLARYDSFRKSKNYFSLNHIPIIIKISRLKPPYNLFWDIGKKYIDYFNENYADYILILLKSEKEGWYFNKNLVNKYIEEKQWHLRNRDNTYKIITLFTDVNKFNSSKEFLAKVNLFRK